jgi:hypothetical protein
MFCTIDFETYYGKGVGFSVHTTEEYINHPEFHVIGMGIKCGDGDTEWVSGDEEIRQTLEQIDWEHSPLLCHNALFDGAILAWRFGVIPAFYFDTLCMARAIHGVEAGGSLAGVARGVLCRPPARMHAGLGAGIAGQAGHHIHGKRQAWRCR